MTKVRFQVIARYPMTVWFKIDHIEWEEKLEKIAKKYGGREYGAGSDFKTRDIHYGGFKSESDAKKFANRLKRYKYIKTTKVSKEEIF